MPESSNHKEIQELTDSRNDDYVKHLAICLQKHPELQALIDRWDTLPEAIRKAILRLAEIDT